MRQKYIIEPYQSALGATKFKVIKKGWFFADEDLSCGTDFEYAKMMLSNLREMEELNKGKKTPKILGHGKVC